MIDMNSIKEQAILNQIANRISYNEFEIRRLREMDRYWKSNLLVHENRILRWVFEMVRNPIFLNRLNDYGRKKEPFES